MDTKHLWLALVHRAVSEIVNLAEDCGQKFAIEVAQLTLHRSHKALTQGVPTRNVSKTSTIPHIVFVPRRHHGLRHGMSTRENGDVCYVTHVRTRGHLRQLLCDDISKKSM